MLMVAAAAARGGGGVGDCCFDDTLPEEHPPLSRQLPPPGVHNHVCFNTLSLTVLYHSHDSSVQCLLHSAVGETTHTDTGTPGKKLSENGRAAAEDIRALSLPTHKLTPFLLRVGIICEQRVRGHDVASVSEGAPPRLTPTQPAAARRSHRQRVRCAGQQSADGRRPLVTRLLGALPFLF